MAAADLIVAQDGKLLYHTNTIFFTAACECENEAASTIPDAATRLSSGKR